MLLLLLFVRQQVDNIPQGVVVEVEAEHFDRVYYRIWS